MKVEFRVRGETQDESTVVEFFLQRGGPGGAIQLMAKVTGHGFDNCLALIRPGKPICMSPGVGKRFGLPLDTNNRVLTD